MTRGQRGRAWAELEFAAAILGIFAAALVFVAAPSSIEPMFYGGPRVASIVVVGSGIAGVAVGLVWMTRIYRADPEPDQRAWRYRDRD